MLFLKSIGCVIWDLHLSGFIIIYHTLTLLPVLLHPSLHYTSLRNDMRVLKSALIHHEQMKRLSLMHL